MESNAGLQIAAQVEKRRLLEVIRELRQQRDEYKSRCDEASKEITKLRMQVKASEASHAELRRGLAHLLREWELYVSECEEGVLQSMSHRGELGVVDKLTSMISTLAQPPPPAAAAFTRIPKSASFNNVMFSPAADVSSPAPSPQPPFYRSRSTSLSLTTEPSSILDEGMLLDFSLQLPPPLPNYASNISYYSAQPNSSSCYHPPRYLATAPLPAAATMRGSGSLELSQLLKHQAQLTEQLHSRVALLQLEKDETFGLWQRERQHVALLLKQGAAKAHGREAVELVSPDTSQHPTPPLLEQLTRLFRELQSTHVSSLHQAHPQLLPRELLQLSALRAGVAGRKLQQLREAEVEGAVSEEVGSSWRRLVWDVLQDCLSARRGTQRRRRDVPSTGCASHGHHGHHWQ